MKTTNNTQRMPTASESWDELDENVKDRLCRTTWGLGYLAARISSESVLREILNALYRPHATQAGISCGIRKALGLQP